MSVKALGERLYLDTGTLTPLLKGMEKKGLITRKRSETAGQFDRFEAEQIDFHRTVRRSFLELAEAEPERIKVIDAARDQRSVHEDIVRIIHEFI